MQPRIQAIRRERSALLVAFAFFLVGVLLLVIRGPFSLLRTWAFVIVAYFISFAVAHAFLNRHLPDRDPLLLPVGALLTGWGLVLIGRLAINFLLRQTVWLLISMAALLAIVRLSRNLRWLRRFRYTWLFGGLALLAATLVFGVNPSGYGPRLWLGAWGIYFQPSEPLKLLMVVYLASYLAERRELLISERWRVGPWQLPPLAYVGPLLAMFGLTIVLLGWQQDLGAAMLFFFTFLAMLYLATGQWEYVATGLALFLVVGAAGYRFSDRIALRVDGWLNPWPGAADRSFQIVQSLLAFGAGGILGQGLGMGNPTYIPAVHTDFVFAAIGEEFGLAGTLVTIALYGILMLRGFRASARASRPFEHYLAAGLTGGLIIQAWVIMVGNAKLAPIAGVTLPFVSYGGSSLLISFIALGLLLRISSPQPSQSSTQHPISNTQYPISRPHPPLLHLTSTLSLALILLAATCGYWAVARADYLRDRDDNPRRVLYEQRIVRGRILDRHGVVLADVEVDGDGTVSRRYLTPEAVPAVGYASLRYGTGGIEAAFDAELRGEADRDKWLAAWENLLHRPLHGRDVQLTIDAPLQIQAQQALALANQAGAVVLLDAATGEVLTLASHPTFDPEHLDEEWETLSQDPAAPLVNRAAQGLFQPGTALQTVVIAEALIKGQVDLSTPALNAREPVAVNGTMMSCSAPPREPFTLARAYAAACPLPFADLGERLGAAALEEAVVRWSLVTPPRLEIPTEAPDWDAQALSTTASLRLEATGQGKLTVSPLQMAFVAGTLANEGKAPALSLVLRVQDPEGRWQSPASDVQLDTVLASETASALLDTWSTYGTDVIGHPGMAIAGRDQPPHAWFLGVAPAQAPRYAVSVLIERSTNPQQAIDIGVALLQTTLH
jgi:cell division protein FtsW (lipid II flippase)/cell division protein FtsI/penicillin-binding protein 2